MQIWLRRRPCLVDLNEPIYRFLPEFGSAGVGAKRSFGELFDHVFISIATRVEGIATRA